jgi:hypothetical protein
MGKGVGSPYWQPYDASQGAKDRNEGDCTVRALSAARGISYDGAFDILHGLEAKHRNINSMSERLGVIRRLSFPARAGTEAHDRRRVCEALLGRPIHPPGGTPCLRCR